MTLLTGYQEGHPACKNLAPEIQFSHIADIRVFLSQPNNN